MAINRFLVYFFVFSTSFGFAQQRWAIRFTDKNNSTYSINNPQNFLSQKSINRRLQQQIAITNEDLPVNQQYIDSILSYGVIYINRSKWMNLVVVQVVDTSIYGDINSLPFVSSIGIIKRNDTLTSPKKNSKLDYKSFQQLDYGQANDQIKIMQGEFLHNNGYMGEGITIAVLDAGFNNVHILNQFASLWSEQKILGYWDFVNNNASVFDKHYHGTAVLSTMAVKEEGFLVGTAPNANYWLLRTEDAATESISEEYNWLAAAEFADSVGADVINSSLGYTTFDDASQNHTYADMNGNSTIITQAANIAFSKGMIVVNSAGNSGNGSWFYIGAPADGKNVLAIGAVDRNANVVNFSSRGPSFDGRIKPDVSAIGFQSAVINENGDLVYSNGTSFSSPEVAGLVAALWQVFPAKTNKEIIEAIKKSADHYTNPNNSIGYGIPNFRLAYLHLTGFYVENIYENQVLSVYPQPYQHNFTIAYYSAINQQLQLAIYDLSGKQVYDYSWAVREGIVETTSISTPLSAGIYYLNIIDGKNKVITRKLIKQ